MLCGVLSIILNLNLVQFLFSLYSLYQLCAVGAFFFFLSLFLFSLCFLLFSGIRLFAEVGCCFGFTGRRALIVPLLSFGFRYALCAWYWLRSGIGDIAAHVVTGARDTGCQWIRNSFYPL